MTHTCRCSKGISLSLSNGNVLCSNFLFGLLLLLGGGGDARWMEEAEIYVKRSPNCLECCWDVIMCNVNLSEFQTHHFISFEDVRQLRLFSVTVDVNSTWLCLERCDAYNVTYINASSFIPHVYYKHTLSPALFPALASVSGFLFFVLCVALACALRKYTYARRFSGHDVVPKYPRKCGVYCNPEHLFPTYPPPPPPLSDAQAEELAVEYCNMNGMSEIFSSDDDDDVLCAKK
jgi:hypothetical protein